MEEHPDRPDMKPGDVVPPGTPSSGDAVCPGCGGGGRRGDAECEACAGTGRVNEPVGGA